MKTKIPLILLLCTLFIGFSPSEQEWSIVLINGVRYTDVSLLRFDRDTLVVLLGADSAFIPVNNIREISSRSLILGLRGCWFTRRRGLCCRHGTVRNSKRRRCACRVRHGVWLRDRRRHRDSRRLSGVPRA